MSCCAACGAVPLQMSTRCDSYKTENSHRARKCKLYKCNEAGYLNAQGELTTRSIAKGFWDAIVKAAVGNCLLPLHGAHGANLELRACDERVLSPLKMPSRSWQPR